VKIEHIFAVDQHLQHQQSSPTDTEQKQKKRYTLKFMIITGITVVAGIGQYEVSSLRKMISEKMSFENGGVENDSLVHTHNLSPD
jgi:hypothetical protein